MAIELTHDQESAADLVYASLESEALLPDSISVLYEAVKDDDITDFQYFAVAIADLAWEFCDSELADYEEIDVLSINDGQRLSFMRSKLYGRLQDPLEGTAAAHWVAISTLNGNKFFLCALGTIQGYSPRIDWVGPFLTLDDFYEELGASGYVLTGEQVDNLPDSELMKYWEREQEVPSKES